ncbi:MAG: hypothetical protein MI922_19985 [Bacteroidales bacterium]|nr:hypothetical protein [Bacteroidales bacterium]
MKKILLILFSIVFMLSAIAKIIYLDQFELYIFSFQRFNFNIVSILSRLLISFELMIAIFILTGKYFQLSWKLSIASLSVFSVFLLVQVLNKSDDHCHCFGEIIKMSPLVSLIKNLVLIGLLMVIRNSKDQLLRIDKLIAASFVIACITIPVAVSKPDFVKKYRKIEYKQNPLLNLRSVDSVRIAPFLNEKKVLVFLSPSCEHCKIAIKKITHMALRNKIENEVMCIFIGEDAQIHNFFRETDAYGFKYISIPAKVHMSVTQRRVPQIFFSDNGNAIEVFRYQELTGKDMRDFLEVN